MTPRSFVPAAVPSVTLRWNVVGVVVVSAVLKKGFPLKAPCIPGFGQLFLSVKGVATDPSYE